MTIVYCPTCRVETMPSDINGCCFFCDTLIAKPVADATVYEASRYCAHCDGEIPADRGGGGRNANNVLYCSENCRRRGWDKSPAGIASRDRKSERDNRSRWLARRAAGIPEEPWKSHKKAA